ncbi:DUF6807 domain-containing protein [Botrimarina hoheduenensis]|uniref:Methane oxygenase PmoA n=1 Tax=Botrimarina hoheduenensis TaxID=2528000 RepID=A0A5C5VQ96_9BACT|nr:PmoA family protein [Botrimarina hoheduenensis]TWT40808.1 hypothetical protein Pla111_32260 [Botrimarina hoheduenensis]
MSDPAEIVTERTGDRVRVLIDGLLFAEYQADDVHQPVIWPIHNAAGNAVTRSYPLGPALAGEAKDHPHHRSLWFAHGDVNGHDFWQLKSGPTALPVNRIVHQEFVEVHSAAEPGMPASIITRNQWQAADLPVLSDTRTISFGQTKDGSEAPVRWIDFQITLQATEGPVTLGDTKEGTFGVRVAGPMKVDSRLGGRLVDTAGAQDANAWSSLQPWTLYSGPTRLTDADKEPVDIAAIGMMNHPSSTGGACRWHVRTYGLMAANPFGESDFNEPHRGGRPRLLAAGDSWTFRYRVLVFVGCPDVSRMHDLYNDYAATKVATP